MNEHQRILCLDASATLCEGITDKGISAAVALLQDELDRYFTNAHDRRCEHPEAFEAAQKAAVRAMLNFKPLFG